MEESRKSRDLYFDTLKFLLILLVVIGHTLEKFGRIETDSFSLGMYFTMYTFHMSLFVFISGYFTSNDKQKGWKSIVKIAETFIVFQLIRLCLSGDWSFIDIITPKWTLWYLLSLICWRSIVILLPPPSKISQKHKLLWFLFSIVLCILVGFIPIETEFSFQRTFNFFPFFLAGFFMKGTDSLYKIRKANHWIFAFLFISVSAFIYWYNKPLYGFLLFQNYDLQFQILPQIFLKIMILTISVLMSLAILNLVSSLGHSVAKYGQKTLFIYIYHTFLIEILINVFHLQEGYFSSLIYSLLIFILLVALSHIVIMEKSLNPIFNSYKALKQSILKRAR